MEFTYYNSVEELDDQYIEDNVLPFRELYDKLIDQLPPDLRVSENITVMMASIFFNLDAIDDIDHLKFPVPFFPDQQEDIIDFCTKLHVLVVLFYMEDNGEVVYNKETGKFCKK